VQFIDGAVHRDIQPHITQQLLLDAETAVRPALTAYQTRGLQGSGSQMDLGPRGSGIDPWPKAVIRPRPRHPSPSASRSRARVLEAHGVDRHAMFRAPPDHRDRSKPPSRAGLCSAIDRTVCMGSPSMHSKVSGTLNPPWLTNL
jgi:hypothetical protein